jgi:hypothetical protein
VSTWRLFFFESYEFRMFRIPEFHEFRNRFGVLVFTGVFGIVNHGTIRIKIQKFGPVIVNLFSRGDLAVRAIVGGAIINAKRIVPITSCIGNLEPESIPQKPRGRKEC